MVRIQQVNWRVWLTASVLASLVLTTFAFAGTGNEFPANWYWGDDDTRKIHNAMLGKPAPALDLAHWINGEVTAEDMKGKIVIVDFWATWCGPCIGSIPKNNKLYKKYKDRGVTFIGVCGSSSGQEEMHAVAKKHKIQYPIARDHTTESAKAWHVRWWPTYAVVDRNGVLRAIGLKPHAVSKVVEKLLKEQPE